MIAMPEDTQKPNPPRPQPGDTVIGFTDAEKEIIHRSRDEENKNPSAVVDAFAGDEGIIVDGRQIGPFTLGHFLFLERIKHPAADSTAKRNFTNMETATVIYVLSRPVSESRDLLRNGREAFDDAVNEFSDTIPFRRLELYGSAIRKLMQAEFATVTGGGEPSKKKTDTTLPPNPTDSAGA